MATDKAPKATSATRPKGGGGITPQSLRITFGIWAFGIVAFLAAILSAGLLVIVPALSLENETWNSPDNPHNWANVCFYLTIGIVAIVAARSTDRKRILIGLAVALIYFAYGFYKLGVFNT